MKGKLSELLMWYYCECFSGNYGVIMPYYQKLMMMEVDTV